MGQYSSVTNLIKGRSSLSSVAVRKRPCLLIPEKKIQAFKTKCLRSRSPHILPWARDFVQSKVSCLSHSWVYSSGNCQEMQAQMIYSCPTQKQPLQNHPSGDLGERVTLLSAEKMLVGQHQSMDGPVRSGTAPNGLQQKRLEEGLCWITHHDPPTHTHLPKTQSVERLNWTVQEIKFKLLNCNVLFFPQLHMICSVCNCGV